MTESMPIKWYKLISQLERLYRETGLRPSSVWDLVHAEKYEEALAKTADFKVWAELHVRALSQLPPGRV